MSFSYNLTQEQETRMKELIARNGRNQATLNEKANQVFDRGLSTLELQYRNREVVKDLIERGRRAKAEEATERPTSAPAATFTEQKRR